MRRAIAFFSPLVIAAAIYAVPTAARACSCMRPPPPQEALEEADAVFQARTFSRTAVDDMKVRFEFEVTRVWKGEVDGSATILTNNNSAACGRNFREGVSYVIYARRGKDGELHDGLCSRTREVDGASEDLAALGEGKKPGEAPGPAPETPTEPPRIEPSPTPEYDPPPTEPSSRGCAVGSTPPATALLVLALAWRRRRRT